jgi:outer membrane protein assembly factor BamB
MKTQPCNQPGRRPANKQLTFTRTGLSTLLLGAICWFATGKIAKADDWPQWMGPQRDGVWREKGIIDKFPADGLPIRWRIPVHRGYCGPAIAGDRLFMMDRQPGPPLTRKPGDHTIPAAAGNERVVCLDANTGKLIWEHIYDCPYRIGYPSGPRTTPVVAAERVYSLGAMGDLLCLDVKDGKVIWERHFLKDFELVDPPTWGYAAHPLLDGQRLICLVGGTNSAVVAFDKDTGKEIWRALTAVEIGYAPPVLQTVAGKKQLIIWHPDALAGVEPESGKVLWTRKYPVGEKPQRPEVTIATPRIENDRIFVSSFYHGALLLQVTNNPFGASVVWNRHSTSESDINDGLHTTMCTPIFKGGHIYGLCGKGELRCLDAKTGDRIWESEGAVGGKPGLFATAFLVQHEDRVFIWNDQGELILAHLTPRGFDEISRTKLLETSENTRGRDIIWCHPAYANRCAYMHNGKEMICVSLAATAKG